MLLNSKKPKIIGNIELKKVEASRFFEEMNEFNQNSITSKNIKGNVTVSISFSAEFLKKNLELNKEKLTANINYKLEQGEIKEVPLLKKLYYFLNSKHY